MKLKYIINDVFQNFPPTIFSYLAKKDRMGSRNYKDPVTGKDTRYELISVLLDDGKIDRLTDIFKFIPKTTVARDLHIGLEDWDLKMQKPELFTLKKIFRLADLCGITERQVMDLVLAELEARKREEDQRESMR